MNKIGPEELFYLLNQAQADLQLLNLYMGYQPDSQTIFNKYPEFPKLFSRFIADNYENNVGDSNRLWSLILNCRKVLEDGIPGDLAELGVYKGNTAAVLAHYAKTFNRKAFFFDTYAGFDDRDFIGLDSGRPQGFEDTSLGIVRELIGEDSSCCEYIIGYFPASLREADAERIFSVVSIDCDLYEPIKAGLDFFYPRLSKGGALFLHDYSSDHWKGATQAIDEFCLRTGENLILMPDKSGSAFIRKSK